MNIDGESEMPRLDHVQSWMQAVITHSGGVLPGLASGAARRALDLPAERVEEIVAPSATLRGAERLAIYHRSYHARLLECFRSIFPALRQALGPELFDRFALDYLAHYPPAGYTLDRLADNFPRHLEETRPDADAPPGERESWPDFMIELATLELAYLDVYDGPGIEGIETPEPFSGSRRSLACVFPSFTEDKERTLKTCGYTGSDQVLLDTRPLPAPCLRLFSFRYPVHAYRIMARRGDRPELPAPAGCRVAMTRRNYRVETCEIDRRQYDLLLLLDGSRTLGDALSECAADGPAVPIETAREWLRSWTVRGFLMA